MAVKIAEGQCGKALMSVNNNHRLSKIALFDVGKKIDDWQLGRIPHGVQKWKAPGERSPRQVAAAPGVPGQEEEVVRFSDRAAKRLRGR